VGNDTVALGSDRVPSRDVLKALGDNTRYAIYLELARAARPLGTAEIAEALGLHTNTVRPHLDRMREAGLVDVTTDGRGEVGRPQHRFSLAAEAPSLGLEPPTVPVLARMVLNMAERLEASSADAFAVGEAEGAGRAAGYAAYPSALEALVDDLDRLGFDPVVAESDTADNAVVAFANCPFAAYAASHPDLVCGLHNGLVAGFVDTMGDAEIVEFCSIAHRTPCQVELTSR
jgi:predicted ArsR family transcriptional regulator